MNKLRLWIQYYLGILGLEKAAQRRDIELRQGIDMLVDRINLLSTDLGCSIQIINERLGRIENMFVSQHVPQRKNVIVEYDWDQVQSMVLNEMMKNPPKEEN